MNIFGWGSWCAVYTVHDKALKKMNSRCHYNWNWENRNKLTKSFSNPKIQLIYENVKLKSFGKKHQKKVYNLLEHESSLILLAKKNEIKNKSITTFCWVWIFENYALIEGTSKIEYKLKCVNTTTPFRLCDLSYFNTISKRQWTMINGQ